MVLSGQGWAVRDLVHPQYQVARDAAGNLVTVVHRAEGKAAVAEAWLWIELYPPVGASAEDALPDLAEALENSLADLEAAFVVQDYVQAFARSDAMVVAATGANVLILFQICFVEHGLTTWTLDPQSLGNAAPVSNIGLLDFRGKEFFKPGHGRASVGWGQR